MGTILWLNSSSGPTGPLGGLADQAFDRAGTECCCANLRHGTYRLTYSQVIRHADFACLLTLITYNPSRCCGGWEEMRLQAYESKLRFISAQGVAPQQAQEMNDPTNQESPCEVVSHDHIG